MSPRPLQQAPFRVLVGANMPAVLVEIGFLTNPQQEQRLASDDYQNALVQALVDGIVRYRAATQAASDGGRADAPSGADVLLIAVVASLAAVHRRCPAGTRREARVADATSAADGPRAGSRQPTPARKITATLFYVTRRRLTLVPAPSARSPFAATVADQARGIIEAQLAAGRPPLVSAIPPAPSCATSSSPRAATPSSICAGEVGTPSGRGRSTSC